MKNLKLFFSALTVAFGILGLTKALSTDITMPIMFVCLTTTMFITSKEYKDKQQKSTAVYFLLLGIFLLARKVCEKKREYYIIFFLASFYLFGSAPYMASSTIGIYVPYLMALFLFPLFASVVFTVVSGKRKIIPFFILHRKICFINHIFIVCHSKACCCGYHRHTQ